jgi:hypothetical protein
MIIELEIDGFVVRALARLAMEIWTSDGSTVSYSKEYVRARCDDKNALELLFEVAGELEIGTISNEEDAVARLSHLPPQAVVIILDLAAGKVFQQSAAETIERREARMVGVGILPLIEQSWLFWRPVSYPHVEPRTLELSNA